MCLAFLVRNPHQLGKLLFEIDTVLKDKRVPDIDDLDKLKYTEMVIIFGKFLCSVAAETSVKT